MRIRTIKPEFWSNEDIATISDKAKLLALALLNYSDDEGYFRANPKLIKASLFPLSASINIPVVLRELSGIGYIELCKGNDGKEYGRLPTFLNHQVINKSTDSRIKDLWTLPENSGSTTVGLPTGTGNREQGTGNREQGGFESFWKIYPKKREKKESLKIWKKINPDEELIEIILYALQKQLNYKKQCDKKEIFCPDFKDPKRWLSKECWTDVIEEIIEDQKKQETRGEIKEPTEEEVQVIADEHPDWKAGQCILEAKKILNFKLKEM